MTTLWEITDDAQKFPVCTGGKFPIVVLVTSQEYFERSPTEESRSEYIKRLRWTPLERDEFSRLVCPACGCVYGQEWPGV